MTFDEIIEHCKAHPNGTYNLVPLVDPEERTVQFTLGNSLLLRTDVQSHELEGIIGKVFRNVHPNRIHELMLLPNALLKGNSE